MCTNRRDQQAARVAEVIPFPAPSSPSSPEVAKGGRVAEAMRRRRVGVAADILTSPTGIPAVPKMGGR